MITFSDLPGVRRKEIRAARGKSVSEAMQALKRHRCVTWASDYGSYNVYRRDDRRWCCEFFRWRVTVDERIFTTKREVREWLKRWLPQCDTPPK